MNRNPPRKCKHCKDKFIKKAFNQKHCMEKDECVAAFYKEHKANQQKLEDRKQRTEKKEELAKLKSYGEWLSDLEDVINPIARLIDWSNGCISCGGFGKPQAGHYHTVASDGSIRFNLHNIHLQDYYCNVHKSANQRGYDEGLTRIYSPEYLDYVKYRIKNDYHQPIKLQVFEIKEKIVICRRIIKELEQNKTQRSPEERLQLRNKYNKEIGIYNLNFQDAA
jgi:hypothetical protein